MPKTLESELTLFWPVFAGTAGTQDPGAFDHLHQVNPNTLTACCAWGHVNILWYHLGLPVCLSSTEVPARDLGWRPPESAVDHLALLGAKLAWCVLHPWLINIEFSLLCRWEGERSSDQTDTQVKCGFLTYVSGEKHVPTCPAESCFLPG